MLNVSSWSRSFQHHAQTLAQVEGTLRRRLRCDQTRYQARHPPEREHERHEEQAQHSQWPRDQRCNDPVVAIYVSTCFVAQRTNILSNSQGDLCCFKVLPATVSKNRLKYPLQYSVYIQPKGGPLTGCI